MDLMQALTCRTALLFAAGLLTLESAQPLRGAEALVRGPLVIGHRGLAKHAPENTLSNMRACLELRVSIELDVRRCKGGTLVVLDDATLQRTTNGKGNVDE